MSKQSKYEAELASKVAGTPPNECLCPLIPMSCAEGHCTLEP
ncbi:MAG: hypothetical protein U0414_00665 [Polyangiaceae bacterium]